MNRFLALTFVFAAAAAAPQTLLPAGTFAAGHLGHLGVGHLGVGHLGAVAHAAPVAVAHAAPVAVAHAAPVAVPAPYTTSSQAAGVTTVHQPEPVVTKEVHYGQTSYISGYNTAIHKPPTPHLPIAVPTVLRGSHQVNPAVVATQTEVHTVNEPVYVERRVEVPYDVPVYTENIIEVPTPVHVDAPYEVPYPVAVAGEPIIKHSVAPAVHTTSHHANVAPVAVAHAGVAHGFGYGLAGGALTHGYGLAGGLLHAAE